MGEVRCNSCRAWFDSSASACPECEWERPGFNRWLATAELNSHLYKSVEAASPKNDYQRTYKHFRKEIARVVRES